MSAQCINCGQPVIAPAQLCQQCRSERRAGKAIVLVIAVAVVGLAAIGGGIYFALTSGSANPAISSPTAKPNPPANHTGETSSANPNNPTNTTTSSSEAIGHYSDSLQPLLSALNQEMAGVVLDLKQFLKDVNATQDSRESRHIIDNFRDQLKARELRLAELNGRLKSISPPPELAQQHSRLSNGVTRYDNAVQEYVRGLAAYSFNQIRAGQSDLTAADSEIKAAADDFQITLTRLLSSAK